MLETVVRPFQTPTALRNGVPTRSINKVLVDPVEIKWGSAGTLPGAVQQDTPGPPTGVNLKVIDCDDKYSEAKRNTITIKIANPSEPSQYVMVERIQSISFQHQTKDQYTSSYNKSFTTKVTPATMPTIVGAYPLAKDLNGLPMSVLTDESKLCKSTYNLKNN